MENFLKQDMLKIFLLLLRSVSVFIFVSSLIPITDKKSVQSSTSTLCMRHAIDCSLQLHQSKRVVSQLGLSCSPSPLMITKLNLLSILKKLRYRMLVDNVINIMVVRGLWIRFLYMISKHHIYPVQKRPPKVNLFNFTFRGSHKINRGGARTDPSLYS